MTGGTSLTWRRGWSSTYSQILNRDLFIKTPPGWVAWGVLNADANYLNNALIFPKLSDWMLDKKQKPEPITIILLLLKPVLNVS